MKKILLFAQSLIFTTLLCAQTNTTGTFTLNDYSYIAPEGWFTQTANDYIRISEMENSDKGGCLIYIMAPQPSSGSLEKDARNFFNATYTDKSWSTKDYFLNHEAKGISMQGHEFYRIYSLMERDLGNGNIYMEKCEIVVVGFGSQVVFINLFHERGNSFSTCFCEYRYNTRDRMFNTFTSNNHTLSKNKATEEFPEKIIGLWRSVGTNTSSSYIFAPNNRYEFIGAYGTETPVDWNIIKITIKGFRGNGSYHIKGDKLTTIKDSKKKYAGN